MLTSCLCTQAQMESREFRGWFERMRQPFGLHRKYWEFCYIAQALFERGLLAPGKRGLGFGVGKEQLVSLFAAFGCEIVATDLDAERAKVEGWYDTGQYAPTLEALNEYGLCDPETFRRNVSFRVVDMNDIPDDLTGFDFTWSGSSLDHCGTLGRATDFLFQQMKCLKPGGFAVHTTEYNVSSNRGTVEFGPTICFRRRDIEAIADRLSDLGHAIELDLRLGRGPADLHVDLPPFDRLPHLRVRWCDYDTTSIGLTIAKDGGPSRSARGLRALARRIGRRLAGERAA